MGEALPRRLGLIASLYGALALLVVFHHAYEINYGKSGRLRAQRHAEVLDPDRGLRPWATRVGAPMVAEAAVQALAPTGWPHRERMELGYLALRLVSTWAALLALHLALCASLPPAWALCGGLLFAAYQAPAALWYWFQPNSPVDLFVWVAAMALAERRRGGWLVPLVVLGALFRSTAIFAVPVYAALAWGRDRPGAIARVTLPAAAGWAAVTLSLHALIEVDDWAQDRTPADYLSANANPEWLAFAVAFLLPVGVGAAAGWRVAPARFRRLVAVAVPYAVLVAAFGRLREVRLLLPVVALLLPLAAHGLRDRLDAPAQRP